MVIFKLLSCKYAEVIKTHTEINNQQWYNHHCDSHTHLAPFSNNMCSFLLLLCFFFLHFLRVDIIFLIFLLYLLFICKDKTNYPLSVVFQLLQTYLFFSNPRSYSILYMFSTKKQKTGDVMSWFKIQSCAYMWVYMQLCYSLCKFFKGLCIDAYKKRTYMRIKKVKEVCLSDELRLSEHILNISNMSQK